VQANHDLMMQANAIRLNLKIDKISSPADAEVIAVIAYLQRLGKDISTAPKDQTAGQ
jgi:cytochrome c oxidase cbb3-type subunit I/II